MASVTKIAGAGTDDDAVGTEVWEDASNIIADDDEVAWFYNSDSPATLYTHYLKASSFGFSIPSTATVNGIAVTIKKQGGGGGRQTYDNVVKLIKAGSVTGDNKADIDTLWPDEFTLAAYGSSSDLWGAEWTPDDINSSNFGVVLSAKMVLPQLSTGTGYVYYVSVTVYYTEAIVITDASASLSGSGASKGSSKLVMESVAEVLGEGVAEGSSDVVIGAISSILGEADLSGSPDVLADLSGLLAGSSVMSSGTPVVVVDATMTRKTFVFSGTNRVDLNPYVPIPEKMFSNESFVFEAEINLPAVTTLQTIYSDSANDQFSYDRIVVQGGKLVVQFVNQGANELALVSNRSISPNTWTKVKVVRSGFDFTIYINGEEDASGTWNKGVWSYAPVQQGTANSSLGVTYYAWNFMAPLTGSIRNVNLIPVGFTASGDLSASPLLVLLGEAGLGGSGDLSAYAVRILDSSAEADGAGDLLADGDTLIGLVGRFAGEAQALSTGGVLVESSSSLAGEGVVSATAPILILDVDSPLGGSATLGASGRVLIGASGLLAGEGLASADTPGVLVEGISHLSGEGDLASGEAELVLVGVAILDGAGRLRIAWIRPRIVRIVVDATRTRAVLAPTLFQATLTPTRTKAVIVE